MVYNIYIVVIIMGCVAGKGRDEAVIQNDQQNGVKHKQGQKYSSKQKPFDTTGIIPSSKLQNISKKQQIRGKQQPQKFNQPFKLQKIVPINKKILLKKYQIKGCSQKTFSVNSYQYDTLLSHNPDFGQSLNVNTTNISNNRNTAAFQ